MSNKAGFKQSKQKTVKQSVTELHTAVANIQQALSIQKIVFEQFATGFGKLDKDINNAMGIINDLQYRTLALLELTGQTEKVNDIATRLKLKDFSEASDKEDANKGYVDDSIVKEDSVIVLTSICKTNPDRSIFRTKFKLDEEVVLPELKEKLLGLVIGNKVEAKLPDGLTHELEVIAIKKVLPKIESKSDAVVENVTPVQ